MSTKTLEQETAEAINHYMSSYGPLRVRLRTFLASQREREVQQTRRDATPSRSASNGLASQLLKTIKTRLAKFAN